jgi:hypothetical protein
MSAKHASPPERRIRCFTRAVKNARYLQAHDPATFAKDKDAEGFGTGVPVHILNRLHLLRPDSAELQGHDEVVRFLEKHAVPKPERWQR